MRFYKQMLPYRKRGRYQRGGKLSFGKLKKIVGPLASKLGPSVVPLVSKGIDYGLSKALTFGKKKFPKHADKLAMAENLLAKAAVGDRVGNLLKKKMSGAGRRNGLKRLQSGGKIDFRGLAKSLAPSVTPLISKVIDAAVSKAFAYGKKRFPKRAKGLSLIENVAKQANLGGRFASMLQKKMSGAGRRKRKRRRGQKGGGAGLAMLASAILPSLLNKIF